MAFCADSLKSLLAVRSPRRYGIYPTPFHCLDRFSSAIGREVWIKRDDLISVGVGGNKIRKLGYLVADALAQGADHLVSVGAEQSNHARCVASAPAMMAPLRADALMRAPVFCKCIARSDSRVSVRSLPNT